MKRFIMALPVMVVGVILGSLAFGTASAAPVSTNAVAVQSTPAVVQGPGYSNVMLTATLTPSDTADAEYPSSAQRYDGYQWVKCSWCGHLVRKNGVLAIQIPTGWSVKGSSSAYGVSNLAGSISLAVCGQVAIASIPVTYGATSPFTSITGFLPLETTTVFVYRPAGPVPSYKVGSCSSGMK